MAERRLKDFSKGLKIVSVKLVGGDKPEVDITEAWEREMAAGRPIEEKLEWMKKQLEDR